MKDIYIEILNEKILAKEFGFYIAYGSKLDFYDPNYIKLKC